MGGLRYLVFMAVGLVVASLLFLVLSFLVNANFSASVDYVEGWIVRATCDQYELEGTVRDVRGRPVAYAVVEASYLDERYTTRSQTDGTFVITAEERVCERRPPRSVQLVVMADDFRPKQTSVAYDAGSVEVTLEPRDFRP
jgi:hypothetical protein